MMTAALVEPVQWRMHPKAAPATATSNAERHESPYSE
jgi:hypothetical protein